MSPSPELLLGVDTGGTYTDAVLLDAADRTVVASAKALTTRGDLAIGVSDAIDRISGAFDPSWIRLVSVSTTLATNAVVEGHGSPVLVLLVGFDDAMVTRSGIGSAFGDVIIERIDGGHDHHGDEQRPLDEARVASVLESRGPHVRAVAVASAFAVRNPAHEERIRDAVLESTGLPVTVSSELSEALHAPRRALTAVLNARLLSRIADLVAAVRESLERVGVDAPVMVAKGDGSLAVADAVAQRPIETILSGPAASMVGAGVLSGETDFIFSDIGGTTTDVGQSIGGRPRLAPEGARVGGWRTMVRAIDVRTTGLGGDSEVNTDRADVTVGPRRLVPISLLGHYSRHIVELLRLELADPPPRELAARYVVLPTGARAVSEKLTTIEERVVARLGPEPVALNKAAAGAVERKSLLGLAERGHVQLAGFTPSDAAHVLGLQDNWSTESAHAAAELMAWYTGLSPEELSRRVWSETVRRSAAAVLEVAFGDQVDDAAANRLVSAAIDGSGLLGGVAVGLRPVVPIVAVGGPAEVYYREVAARMKADLVVPEQFFVANAVGAAAGHIQASHVVEVHLDGPGLFRIVSTSGTETDTNATNALDRAHHLAESGAVESLEHLAAGLPQTGAVETHVDIERHDEPEAVGDDGLYLARLRAEARSRPY